MRKFFHGLQAAAFQNLKIKTRPACRDILPIAGMIPDAGRAWTDMLATKTINNRKTPGDRNEINYPLMINARGRPRKSFRPREVCQPGFVVCGSSPVNTVGISDNFPRDIPLIKAGFRWNCAHSSNTFFRSYALLVDEWNMRIPPTAQERCDWGHTLPFIAQAVPDNPLAMVFPLTMPGITSEK